jgi:hypothetical protein
VIAEDIGTCDRHDHHHADYPMTHLHSNLSS